MARLVSSVSDVLDTLQKERGSTRPRLKADLQRAPARGARPRGCSNGEVVSPSVPMRGMCLGLLCTGLYLRIGEGENHLRWGKPAWGRDLIQQRGWEGDWKDGAGGRWEVMFLTVQPPVVHKPACKASSNTTLHPCRPTCFPHRCTWDRSRTRSDHLNTDGSSAWDSE